jgi:hypothetical protein
MNVKRPGSKLMPYQIADEVLEATDQLINALNASTTPSPAINRSMAEFRRDLQEVSSALASYNKTPEAAARFVLAQQAASASGEAHRKSLEDLKGSSFTGILQSVL